MEENLDKELKRLSPLSLAWIGDAVYSLYIRERLINTETRKIGAYHKHSVEFVSAHAQAKAVKALMDELSPAEIRMVKKGKNAVKNVPRSSTIEDYGYATGFEALLGYLYLKKENERLKEILTRSFEILN